MLPLKVSWLPLTLTVELAFRVTVPERLPDPEPVASVPPERLIGSGTLEARRSRVPPDTMVPAAVVPSASVFVTCNVPVLTVVSPV